jgi:integrase/recombinase XerD
MLKDALNTYVAVRRAAGFDLGEDARYLNNFVYFACAQGDRFIVSRTAVIWAEQAPSEPQRGVRMKAVIRFARFAQAVDSRHEVPSQEVFRARRRRPTPYLYTEEEIHALIAQALRLGPPGTLRAQTYSTLIGLLAATGLRISEALGLRFPDVTADGLVIRKTKFQKSRLIPVHPTTKAALERYIVERRRFTAGDDHLFVTAWRRPLTPTAVYPTFIKLLAAAGLPRQAGQARPRLIDLRHTYASNALLACPNSRDHVGSHMLALMTYLGHANPSSTYWYLESSPRLMADIADVCEHWVEEQMS